MVTPAGKHSLYKLVSPLERSGLQQGKLTPASSSHEDTLTSSESTQRSRGHILKQNQAEGGLRCDHAYSPTHQYLDRKSEQRQRTQPGVDPASSPRRVPPSPSMDFPTADHTHSLSLSETEESPSSEPTHYMERQPPTLIMVFTNGCKENKNWPSTGVIPAVTSSGKAVLVVDAGTGSHDPHSTEVQVTTTQAPSPVRVVRHKPSDQEMQGTSSALPENWRRFSSSFVSLPSSRQDGRLGEQQPAEDEDTLAIENNTSYPSHMTSSMGHMTTNKDRPLDHSSGSEATLIASDNLSLTELSTLADSAHERIMSQGVGGVEGEREEVGVRKSASDEVMSTRQRETRMHESPHSKSADLSTILEVSGSSLDQPHAAKRKPKKKGRVIPSRYMAAASGFKKPSQPPASHHQLSTTINTSSNRTAKKSSKSYTGVKAPHAKQDDSFKMPSIPLRAHSSRPSSHPSTFTPHLHFPPTPVSFTPSAMATSTPAVSGMRGTPLSWAAHDGSFIAMSGTSGDSTLVEGQDPAPRTVSTASKTTKSISGVGSQQASAVSDWELELWYNRLLQVTYLNVMSAKALREQEEEAMSQLHILWKTVEQQKRANADLRRRVETEERTIELEKALEVQLNGLGPVCSKLPVLEQQYSNTAKALDTTRHEMTVSGVAPVTEDDLDTELAKSEHLLGEIIAATREKIPKVCHFADSTEALVRTLEKESQELERCWEALGAATKDQIHETSLFFEERQRNRTAPLSL